MIIVHPSETIQVQEDRVREGLVFSPSPAQRPGSNRPEILHPVAGLVLHEKHHHQSTGNMVPNLAFPRTLLSQWGGHLIELEPSWGGGRLNARALPQEQQGAGNVQLLKAVISAGKTTAYLECNGKSGRLQRL